MPSDSPRQNQPPARYLLTAVQVEPTNRCNIQCVYCRNPRIRRRKTLSAELWAKIIANWSPELFPTQIAICGFGEPFLNPDIYDLFDALSDRGAKLFVQSNGRWKLDEGRLDSFFKIGTLRVTVDSIDEAMASVTRPRAHVKEILANLARIVSLRKQRGGQRPRLIVEMNVFRHNQHHAPDLVRACKELGMDGVYLSSGHSVLGLHGTLPPALYQAFEHDPFVTLNPALRERQPLDRLFNRLMLPEPLRVREGRLAARSVRALQRLWAAPPVAGLRTAGASRLYALRSRSASGEVGPEPGPDLFERLGCPNLSVRADGNVTPCCFDTDSTVALGSLLESTMADILAPANVARVARRIVGEQEQRRRTGTSIECDRCSLFRSSPWCRKSAFDVLLRA